MPPARGINNCTFEGRNVNMLHRMEGLGLWGFQGPDRDQAVALGRRALGWLALAGVMFLLCRDRKSVV